MKKRGFTLLELLAVIVILAIIALITVPIVLKTIEKSKKGATKDSALIYVDTVERDIALEDFNDGTYVIKTGDLYENETSEKPYFNIKIKKDKPSSGDITIQNKRVVEADLIINEYPIHFDSKGVTIGNRGEILLKRIYFSKEEADVIKTETTQLSLNYYPANATNKSVTWTSSDNSIAIVDSNGLVTGVKKGTTTITATTTSDKTATIKVNVKSLWSYTDSNSSKTVDIGDIIGFKDENFYIISNDGTNIRALSKYNLYVGGFYNQNSTPLFTAYGSEATGLQKSTMLGLVSGQTTANGVTPFSKGSNDYYAGSIVEGYANKYRTKLNLMSANITAVSLITKAELEGLGCTYWKCSSSNKPWLYSTHYWTSSKGPVQGSWYVDTTGDESYIINTATYSGVRPVITVPLSEF